MTTFEPPPTVPNDPSALERLAPELFTVDLEIKTHQVDSLFDLAHRRGWGFWQMFLIGLVPFMPMVVAAAATGSLIPEAGWARVADDWRRFAFHDTTLGADATFPLLRDYTTLLLVGLVATNTGLGHILLGRLGRSFKAMADEGVLIFDRKKDGDAITASLKATNRMIGKAHDFRIGFLVLSFGAAIGVVTARLEAGLYVPLAPKASASTPMSVDAWATRSQAGWWASPSFDSAIGFFSYLGMMVALAYLILKIDWASVCFIFFWIKNRDRIRFILCHAQPYRGYEDLRAALRSAATLIALDFVVLVAVFISTAESSHRWLVLPVLAFGLLSPTFLLVPMYLFWRHAHAYRRQLVKDCNREIDDLSRQDPIGQVERIAALRTEVAAHSKLPTIPFHWPKVSVTAAAWLISLIAAVLTLWKTL